MSNRPEYTVQTRTPEAHAVMRKGPRGGTRLVSVWRMRHMADDVAAKLNAWSSGEI